MYRIFSLEAHCLLFSLLFASLNSFGQSVDEEALWISDKHDIEYRPASVFRDTFKVGDLPGQAIFRIASLGIHEVEINGQRVGDAYLNPVFTNFSKRVFEKEYEVTDLLHTGSLNTITVTLGNGFYNFQPINNWRFDLAAWRGRPAFRGTLFIEETNEILIRSDSSWKYSDSPWVFNAIYLGETYDQRNIQRQIDKVLFDTKDWPQARPIDTPNISIDPQPPVDVRVTEELYPISVTPIDRFIAVYAFERNIAGIVEVTIPPLRKDQWVSIHYGEQLNDEGRVDNGNLSIAYKVKMPGESFQTDRLFSNGRDTLKFANRFSYKGFQFVEIKSHRPLDFSNIKLKAYSLSSIQPISSFDSGNDLLNELWETANYSIAANMVGLPTDCPTREKNGWTGDGHLIFGSSAYNFDVEAFYRKWATDHKDSQLSNGLVPNIVPTAGYGVERNAFDWTVSTINVPWSHYLYYGDHSILQENYEMMKSFMIHWRAKTRNHLLSEGIGDWKSAVNSSTWFTTSVSYLDALRKMALVANVLGQFGDQRSYEEEANEVLKVINNNFYDREKGVYAKGTQTELAYSLYYDLPANRETEARVAEALVAHIKATNYQVEVGVIGTLPLLGALNKIGRSDMAFRLVTNPKNEIWAGWLKGDSRSLYEGRGFNPEKRYGGSQNHMYFGTYNEWIAAEVAGVKPAFETPGFDKINLQPTFIKELRFIDWDFQSKAGNIQVAWRFLNEEEVELDVSLPKTTEIAFEVPSGFQIREVWPGDLLEAANVSQGTLNFSSSRFTIQFEKAQDELTLQNENTNLYFNGHGIYPDLQAATGSDWEFEVYDLSGRLIYYKKLDLFVRYVPILTIDELPTNSHGMLIGRLIDSNTGELHSSINFLK